MEFFPPAIAVQPWSFGASGREHQIVRYKRPCKLRPSPTRQRPKLSAENPNSRIAFLSDEGYYSRMASTNSAPVGPHVSQLIRLAMGRVIGANPATKGSPNRKLRLAEQAVYDSVEVAIGTLACKMVGLPKHMSQFPAEWLFALLQWKEHRDLSQPIVRDLINQATLMNNTDSVKFFVRLGKVLSKKAVSIEENIQSYALERHLIGSWISGKKNDPGYCNLNDTQISLILSQSVNGMTGINPNSLAKTCDRLGLVKSRQQVPHGLPVRSRNPIKVSQQGLVQNRIPAAIPAAGNKPKVAKTASAEAEHKSLTTSSGQAPRS